MRDDVFVTATPIAYAAALLALSGCDVVFRLDSVKPIVQEESIARWDFDNGSGLVVKDSVEPRLDLVISRQASVTWSADSLVVTEPVTIRSSAYATKLIEACKTTGMLTLEAWVRPGRMDLVGGAPGRVFTISDGPFSDMNLMLGQTTTGEWVVRLRTSASQGQELTTPPVIDSSPALTHLVLVHDTTFRVLYVDGVERARDSLGGDLSAWSDDQRVGIANEAATDEDRAWLGELHRIELFPAVLSESEILSKYELGPD